MGMSNEIAMLHGTNIAKGASQLTYDMHVHSNVSGDCDALMEDVVLAAIDKGLTGFCFTDHLNLFEPKHVGVPNTQSYTSWINGCAKVQEMQSKFGDRIEILQGMEISEITQDTTRAMQYINGTDVDFVLGSAHMVSGFVDFCWLEYKDINFCKKIMSLYLDENIKLAQLGCVDSIGHIGYPLRYMSRCGMFVDIMDYEEKLHRLFKIIVETGQGVEINTSGLRQGTGVTFPHLPALTLYKELGGEIVTIGSDAHFAEDIASNFKEAKDILREVGFKYSTVFRNRKPKFLPL